MSEYPRRDTGQCSQPWAARAHSPAAVRLRKHNSKAVKKAGRAYTPSTQEDSGKLPRPLGTGPRRCTAHAGVAGGAQAHG